MFRLPFLRKRAPDIAELFGDLVAAARAPIAYLHYGVADDFEGRFERLALLATLLLRRLGALPAPADLHAQELVDTLFAHLDDGLRRSGIGDLSVPKRMKKLAQGFYGRAEAYTAALALADSERERALREALARNLYSDRLEADAVPSAQLLEIDRMITALDANDLAGLLAGGRMLAATSTEHAA